MSRIAIGTGWPAAQIAQKTGIAEKREPGWANGGRYDTRHQERRAADMRWLGQTSGLRRRLPIRFAQSYACSQVLDALTFCNLIMNL